MQSKSVFIGALLIAACSPVMMTGQGVVVVPNNVGASYPIINQNFTWLNANKMASPAPASQVIYTAPGAGAVTRTVASKLSDIVSVLDYGAVRDGSTDDTAAFNKAIVAVNAAGGGQVVVPKGTYRAAGIQLLSNVEIVGETAGSIIKLRDHVCDAPPTWSAGTYAAGAVVVYNWQSVPTYDYIYQNSSGSSTTATPTNGSGVPNSPWVAYFDYPCNGNVFSTVQNWDSSSARGGSPAHYLNANSTTPTYVAQTVDIHDLVIDGNKANNSSKDSGHNASWAGAGVNITNCLNCKVHDVILQNNRLDGLFVGYTPQGPSDNGEFSGLTLQGNTRRDIVLTTGSHNQFHNNHLLTPGLGFDWEPNQDGELMTDNAISDNDIRGIVAIGSSYVPIMDRVTLHHNTVSVTAGQGIAIYPDQAPDSVLDHNIVIGPGASVAGSIGISAMMHAYNLHSAQVTYDGNEISGFETGFGMPTTVTGTSVGVVKWSGGKIHDVKWAMRLDRTGDSIVDGVKLWNISTTPFWIGFGQSTTWAGQGGIKIRNTQYSEAGSGAIHLVQQVNDGSDPVTWQWPNVSGATSYAAAAPIELSGNTWETDLSGTAPGGDTVSAFSFSLPGIDLIDNRWKCLAAAGGCPTYYSPDSYVWSTQRRLWNTWDAWDSNGVDSVLTNQTLASPLLTTPTIAGGTVTSRLDFKSGGFPRVLDSTNTYSFDLTTTGSGGASQFNFGSFLSCQNSVGIAGCWSPLSGMNLGTYLNPWGAVWGSTFSGTAANLSGTPALPNGTTATTQTTSDTSTDLATDAFVHDVVTPLKFIYVQPSNPTCSTVGLIWFNTTSAANTVVQFCEEVASALTWVTK